MNLIKFINYYYKIKSLFSYLPQGLQEEVVDDMNEVYELCLIAKIEKLRKDK